MFGTNEFEFQNELLLTDTQVLKLRNQSSTDMKLPKTQILRIKMSGGRFECLLRKLLAGPLIK